VQFRRAVDMNPEFAFARSELGAFLVYSSSIHEGTAEIEKAIKLSPDNVWARPRLAVAYGMAGRKVEAESILREAKEVSSQTYVPGTVFAMIYAVLGQKDLAFESLNRAVREGTSTIVVLSDPVFDSLRTDPRFREILERIGLS